MIFDQLEIQLARMDTVLWTGRVTRLKGMVIESEGPAAAIGDFCEVTAAGGRQIRTQVIGFGEGRVLSMPLEETGVRAYLGAVPYVTDYQKQGGVAQTAVSIYSTEARHSSAINYILGKDPGPSFMVGDNRVTPTYPHENTFEYFLTPAQVFAAVTPLFKSAKPV